MANMDKVKLHVVRGARKYSGALICALVVAVAAGRTVYNKITTENKLNAAYEASITSDYEVDQEPESVEVTENSPIVENLVEEESKEYDFPETCDKVVNYEKNTDLLDDGYTDLLFDVDATRNEFNNQDITSWVVIPGTKVSQPIVQKTTEEDGQYYLDHSLDGSVTKEGSIFQDYRDSSFTNGFDELSNISYTYGHHMRNGNMYAAVDDYQKQNYYEKHPYGVLYTPSDTYKLEIFASNIYEASDIENIYSYDFTDEDTFNAYIDYINENSLIKTDVDVEYGDRIFAFVTCTYSGTPVNNTGDKERRLYVYAKMVPQYTNYKDYENSKALTLSK